MSPNEIKLSDCEAGRDSCVVCGKAEAEAGGVTCAAVRCSAWLGDVSIESLLGCGGWKIMVSTVLGPRWAAERESMTKAGTWNQRAELYHDWMPRLDEIYSRIAAILERNSKAIPDLRPMKDTESIDMKP